MRGALSSDRRVSHVFLHRRTLRPPASLGVGIAVGVYRHPQANRSSRRRVRPANGGMRWHREWVNVSTVWVGEYIGLEDIDTGVWIVWFGLLEPGRFDERLMRIEDQYGSLKRHHV